MSLFRALTLLFLFAFAWGAYAERYKIRSPDGRVHIIEAPEGGPDEKLFAFVQQLERKEKAEEAAKRAQKAREKANSGIISRIRRTIGASNLWECVLDEMPGVKKDLVARVIFQDCMKKFGYANIKKKIVILWC